MKSFLALGLAALLGACSSIDFTSCAYGTNCKKTFEQTQVLGVSQAVAAPAPVAASVPSGAVQIGTTPNGTPIYRVPAAGGEAAKAETSTTKPKAAKPKALSRVDKILKRVPSGIVVDQVGSSNDGPPTNSGTVVEQKAGKPDKPTTKPKEEAKKIGDKPVNLAPPQADGIVGSPSK